MLSPARIFEPEYRARLGIAGLGFLLELVERRQIRQFLRRRIGPAARWRCGGGGGKGASGGGMKAVFCGHRLGP